MKTSLDCIPCFVRQALDAARFVSDDAAVHDRVVREILREITEMDLRRSPPEIARNLHRRLRALTGDDDPYREFKQRFNRMALEMLPLLTAEVRASADPLFMALRMAIAGNVIDAGVGGDMEVAEIRRVLAATLDEPFCGDPDDFRAAVDHAQDILYLADNAGEIVFDRLLIEQLPLDRVTLAVRGVPVLNDATRADAQVSGLAGLVRVIDNGSDAPGTILADCSPEFRRRFAAADLVIAKGQGNFETLSDEPAPIFFLFKAKCAVIADHAGIPLGTHAALRHTPKP